MGRGLLERGPPAAPRVRMRSSGLHLLASRELQIRNDPQWGTLTGRVTGGKTERESSEPSHLQKLARGARLRHSRAARVRPQRVMYDAAAVEETAAS